MEVMYRAVWAQEKKMQHFGVGMFVFRAKNCTNHNSARNDGEDGQNTGAGSVGNSLN